MNNTPGTNYFTPLDENVKISLTNEEGFAVLASCIGNPNVVALHEDIYNTGCEIIRDDVLIGKNVYYNEGTRLNPVWVLGGGGSSSAVWGTITGTLSDQTDLQDALDDKFDVPTGATSEYIRGDGSLAPFPTDLSDFTNDVGFITSIEDGVTTTTGFGADELLFSDGTVVRGNAKLTYDPIADLFQVTDGSDGFLRISAGAKTFAIGDYEGAGPYIESNLTSNELQLVATVLEMAGNRYTFPAVQGTVGQVLAVDSIALGIATLDWITPSTGNITGTGLNTALAVWTGTSTQTAYPALSYNNANGRFAITDGLVFPSSPSRAFFVDAQNFDVSMGALGVAGLGTSLSVFDSSQNIQATGGDGLGGTGVVMDIYTDLSVGAYLAFGDVSTLLNGTVAIIDDITQRISFLDAVTGNGQIIDFAQFESVIGFDDGTTTAQSFIGAGQISSNVIDNATSDFTLVEQSYNLLRVSGAFKSMVHDFGALDFSFGDYALTTSGTDNVGFIQIGAGGVFNMYGIDSIGTLSPFFASYGGGDYAWGDINGVGSASTLTFFDSSGGVWSFNQPNLQFGGIDYRFPNAQGAKGQALVLSDGVGTLQYENVQRSWFEQTQSVTVAGTTTPTSVFGTGQGTRVIAANTVQVGSQYEVEIYGYYVAAAVQTLNYKIEMMGLSLAPGVTPIPPTTVTNSAFRAKFTMTVRTLGASGQAIVDGYVKFDNNNGTNVTYEFNSTSIHTIDTTSAHTTDFIPNWSSNSGSNSLTVLEASIKQTR